MRFFPVPVSPVISTRASVGPTSRTTSKMRRIAALPATISTKSSDETFLVASVGAASARTIRVNFLPRCSSDFPTASIDFINLAPKSVSGRRAVAWIAGINFPAGLKSVSYTTVDAQRTTLSHSRLPLGSLVCHSRTVRSL